MNTEILEPIKTKKQYKIALDRIELLIDCKEDSLEEKELQAISLLVHEYEKKFY